MRVSGTFIIIIITYYSITIVFLCDVCLFRSHSSFDRGDGTVYSVPNDLIFSPLDLGRVP